MSRSYAQLQWHPARHLRRLSRWWSMRGWKRLRLRTSSVRGAAVVYAWICEITPPMMVCMIAPARQRHQPRHAVIVLEFVSDRVFVWCSCGVADSILWRLKTIHFVGLSSLLLKAFCLHCISSLLALAARVFEFDMPALVVPVRTWYDRLRFKGRRVGPIDMHVCLF